MAREGVSSGVYALSWSLGKVTFEVFVVTAAVMMVL